MRKVSPRWLGRKGKVNSWETIVEWSNDGGNEWIPAKLASGSVKCNANSQVRWSTDLVLKDVPISMERPLTGINPFNTRIRIRHGMRGEPLLGMGRYRLDKLNWVNADHNTCSLSASSFEQYILNARFRTVRTLARQTAKYTTEHLIREVLPNASVQFIGVDGDQVLPKMTAERDRWAVIDGPRDAPSIARALSARAFTDGDGIFTMQPVPTLEDLAVWEADEGRDGLLIEAGEELSNEGVYNVIVVWGESTDGSSPPVGPGIAVDNDPLSPTYIGLSPDAGGFGEKPRFYSSQLITTKAQADNTARSMLAQYLGVKQQITAGLLHDPTIEPGDVGIVMTKKGPRRVLIDAATYDLKGGPLQLETRMTQTRLMGEIVEATEDEGEAA